MARISVSVSIVSSEVSFKKISKRINRNKEQKTKHKEKKRKVIEDAPAEVGYYANVICFIVIYCSFTCLSSKLL